MVTGMKLSVTEAPSRAARKTASSAKRGIATPTQSHKTRCIPPGQGVSEASTVFARCPRNRSATTSTTGT